jgi:hypothetical protein
MDHVRLDPTRLEPARQPKAVAAGFEGNRNPRDRAAGPDRPIWGRLSEGLPKLHINSSDMRF